MLRFVEIPPTCAGTVTCGTFYADTLVVALDPSCMEEIRAFNTEQRAFNREHREIRALNTGQTLLRPARHHTHVCAVWTEKRQGRRHSLPQNAHMYRLRCFKKRGRSFGHSGNRCVGLWQPLGRKEPGLSKKK